MFTRAYSHALYVAFFVAVLASPARAQMFGIEHTEQERKAVEAAKSVSVAQLDSTLGDKRLDSWLEQVAGKPATWRAIKCAQGGSFVRGIDPPLCVLGRTSNAEGIEIEVQVALGNFGAGVQAAPRLESSSIIDSSGEITYSKELHLLPELLRIQTHVHAAGILLGFRIDRSRMSEDESRALGSDYLTLFIARDAHGWKSAQLPELLVPAQHGWLRVGTVWSEITLKVKQDSFPYESKVAETKLWIRPLKDNGDGPTVTSEDITCGDTSSTREITFVNNRYLAVDSTHQAWCANYSESQSSDVVALLKPDTALKLSTVISAKAFATASKQSAAVAPDEENCDGAVASEENWLIMRQPGHWSIQARLQSTGGGICNRFSDLEDLHILPSPVAVGWDELPMPWEQLVKLVPQAQDAFFSPTRDFLVIKAGDKFYARPFAQGKIRDPIAEVPIPTNADLVVMSIWLEGSDVRSTLSLFQPKNNP
jgi:hypothetical protein